MCYHRQGNLIDVDSDQQTYTQLCSRAMVVHLRLKGNLVSYFGEYNDDNVQMLPISLWDWFPFSTVLAENILQFKTSSKASDPSYVLLGKK